MRVTEGVKESRFVYGADGSRLLRKDPDATTLYLPGQEVRLATGASAPTVTRYYSHAGKTVAMREGKTKLTWLAADHQGTAQISIDVSSMTTTRRRQLPFGGARGPVLPIAFPGEKGFVGGTNDASTGLVHIGARQYDAALGKFLSVDPIMDIADPQQWNAYAYGNNSPITFSDPTGLIARCGVDGAGCPTSNRDRCCGQSQPQPEVDGGAAPGGGIPVTSNKGRRLPAAETALARPDVSPQAEYDLMAQMENCVKAYSNPVGLARCQSNVGSSHSVDYMVLDAVEEVAARAQAGGEAANAVMAVASLPGAVKGVIGAAIAIRSALVARASAQAAPGVVRAIVDPAKYEYLFGRVSSDAHNAARSRQNVGQFARVGVHNNVEGRALLQGHLEGVAATDGNVMRVYTDQWGTFQIRDSLFVGPGGILHLETTWHVTADGLRLTTVIPRGGR